MNPAQTPVITEYGGTTFRSQLEARWAAYFDKRGIAWEYEPVRLNAWAPDFRLALEGGEAYAEVKPVSEFPMDVAQRILNAGWTGDILILGRGPRHAWRYRGGGDGRRWTSPRMTTASPVVANSPRAEPPAAERQMPCVARSRWTGTRQWRSLLARSRPEPRRW